MKMISRKWKKPLTLFLLWALCAVPLTAYADPDALFAEGDKFGRRTLERGDRVTVFWATPKATVKAASPGDWLMGTMSFGKDESGLTGSGKRPDGFPLRLAVSKPATSDSIPATRR